MTLLSLITIKVGHASADHHSVRALACPLEALKHHGAINHHGVIKIIKGNSLVLKCTSWTKNDPIRPIAMGYYIGPVLRPSISNYCTYCKINGPFEVLFVILTRV